MSAQAFRVGLGARGRKVRLDRSVVEFRIPEASDDGDANCGSSLCGEYDGTEGEDDSEEVSIITHKIQDHDWASRGIAIPFVPEIAVARYETSSTIGKWHQEMLT